MPPVPFILIADDFGLSEGVNKAILDLLQKKRLSGTGVMVNQAACASRAGDLLLLKGGCDLGLHLTLTLGAPLGSAPSLAPDGQFLGLNALMTRAMSGLLVHAEVKAEIFRQITAFHDLTGRFPDFIDGHQHVHVLPVIRHALFDALAEAAPRSKPWLRVPADRFGSIVARGVSVGKALFIAALSLGFAHKARRFGYRVNDTFSGVRSFDPEADFAREFKRFLLVPGQRHLVMCHPGLTDEQLRLLDPVTTARDREYEFFLSDAFDDVLKAYAMRIGRFDDD